MMDSRNEVWIRRQIEPENHESKDSFYFPSVNISTEDREELEKRVEHMEDVIRKLLIDIKKLNDRVKIKEGLDISRASNLDFWLTEEDDIWDKL